MIVKDVFFELETRKRVELYTEDSIIKLIKKAIKLKIDLKYKQKMYCSPQNRKSSIILQFMQDAKDTVKKIYDAIDKAKKEGCSIPCSKNGLEDIMDDPKHKKRLRKDTFDLKSDRGNKDDSEVAKKCGEPCCKERPRSENRYEKNIILNSKDNQFFADEKVENLRGKSCCCLACGGLAYYTRVQRRINIFPSLYKLELERKAILLAARYNISLHSLT